MRRTTGGLAALALLFAAACKGEGAGEAAATASASATASSAPLAPAGERPFTVIPNILADDIGITIGPEKIDLSVATGPGKLKETVARIPKVEGKLVVRAMKKAKLGDVGALLAALGEAGVGTVLLKMDGGRTDLPAEITIVPESRLASADDCSVVASVLGDLSTGVWTVKGGGGKKARRGYAGPDVTVTGEFVTDALKACKSKTAFFSANDKLAFEHAFHMGALIDKLDTDKRIDRLVFLRTEPVAGRRLELGK